VDRIDIVQTALDATGRGSYLEIGICTGESFIPIKASRKWGVDPGYVLSWKRIAKYRLFSLLHIKQEKIFKETSDAFLRNHQSLLKKHGIDVVFVDGLHTYKQSLTDVLNCLDYLKPNGIVLIHDCNPADAVAAIPAAGIDEVGAMNLPGWTGAWSGDVWKTVVHLRSLREDLTTFVLDCDNGIGVVACGRSAEMLPYTERDIKTMDYEFLAKNRQTLLGLRRPEYLDEFLRTRAG
jgi:hypothetical protein